MEERFQAEIAQLRAAYEDKLADLKEIIMLQDKIYRGRFQKMETAISALQPAAIPPAPQQPPRLPRRDRMQGTTNATRSASPSSRAGSATTTPIAARRRTLRSCTSSQEDFPLRKGPQRAALPPAVADVIARHQSRIQHVFDYYATSATGDTFFHPSLGMGGFAKLVRDTKLLTSGGPHHTTPDLLWMTVVRALHARRGGSDTRRQHQHADPRETSTTGATPRSPSRSTMMVRGRYHPASAAAQDQLSFLRVEKLSRSQFGEALFLLWEAWKRPSLPTSVGGTDGGADDADVLRTAGGDQAEGFAAFLTRRVFPTMASAMGKQRRHEASLLSSSYYSALRSSDDDGSHASSALLAPSASAADARFGGPTRDYASIVEEQYEPSPAVKTVTREFASDVKRSFRNGVRGVGNDGMDVDDFFSLVQRHHLLPLIRKVELKQIFHVCSSELREGTSSRNSGALTLGGYVHALYCLAEGIYNVPAVAHHYPTPESRLRKLFTKMFILEC